MDKDMVSAPRPTALFFWLGVGAASGVEVSAEILPAPVAADAGEACPHHMFVGGDLIDDSIAGNGGLHSDPDGVSSDAIYARILRSIDDSDAILAPAVGV